MQICVGIWIKEKKHKIFENLLQFELNMLVYNSFMT